MRRGGRKRDEDGSGRWMNGRDGSESEKVEQREKDR